MAAWTATDILVDADPRSRYPTRVSRDDEAAYVKQWAETGRLLEAQRWVELSRLEPGRALEAADTLIEAALRLPLPASRRTWSGLVELQRILHRHPQ